MVLISAFVISAKPPLCFVTAYSGARSIKNSSGFEITHALGDLFRTKCSGAVSRAGSTTAELGRT
jgi:hypothetical protein